MYTVPFHLKEILKPDEPCHELGCRSSVNILRCVKLLYDAVVHDSHLIGYGETFLLVMGDEQGCDTKLFLKAFYLHPHAEPKLCVQVA